MKTFKKGETFIKCKNCAEVFFPYRKERLTCSKNCSSKIMSKNKLGKINPMWKESGVGYNSLHSWVKRRLKKPPCCSVCRKVTEFIDLANISQKYKRNLTDWEWLCRKCHMTKDGRIENFRPKRVLKDLVCPFCKKLFRPISSKIKFCSQSCSTTFNNLGDWKPKLKNKKICIGCRKYTHSKDRIYKRGKTFHAECLK